MDARGAANPATCLTACRCRVAYAASSGAIGPIGRPIAFAASVIGREAIALEGPCRLLGPPVSLRASPKAEANLPEVLPSSTGPMLVVASMRGLSIASHPSSGPDRTEKRPAVAIAYAATVGTNGIVAVTGLRGSTVKGRIAIRPA